VFVMTRKLAPKVAATPAASQCDERGERFGVGGLAVSSAIYCNRTRAWGGPMRALVVILCAAGVTK